MRFTNKALRSNFLSTCEQLRDGQLTLRTPEGELYRFGHTGPEVEMVIRDWSAVSAMAAHGQVGLGESYVHGLWDTSSIEGLMTVAMKNREHFGAYDKASPLNKAKFRLVDTVLRANSRSGARKNIRSHYDVGNEFYALWLDEGMTYSSGLFDLTDDDLAHAQTRKNARALSRLASGDRLLEIGCGWGGFAEQASTHGYDVTGVTISRNQHSYAECRLDGRADIQLSDYRDINGRYDNIVSIEMVEAVGARYWPSYFATLKRNLAEGGRVLLQAITVKDSFFETYKNSSDYIRQYVFPGGMLLSDSVIATQAKGAGLAVRDNFAFGQDYARTCRIWAERLSAQKRQISDLGYGEGFFRNWHYYLEICAASFAVGHTNVVQVELAHA
ncbi:class I SAM-dependent methyltransferase [Ruegeria pomeroyi]|uniref:Cyclopropane-fatty-acyl-phospholipid synthase family protein n=1 Tax=Ruegeria alba TaxID=2916756 RepID=A0ABS9P0L1_9RHOB|nr:cyclopropane-fatty-acyl-phospholipid synthase family protein [Ruegeria alba]MCE8511878.1 class I SAM-dependent methyltransferase [Ruegeria pomeroyi]MCE8524982.1 class I SAM-dependent methyltransferase [Ruegeria pomeroyi]MCE8528483.1 class I SAM-dependent methyltransferase [Ruegeria pomeroyi]MCG6560032.1 cyclopropane-fatty-acyl-phospholipid synthase family protein [Ruegeria alba]